jgi:hypothetical protein
MARALAESHFLVTIGGYSGTVYFSEKSGGGYKVSSSPYNDGQSRTDKKVIGNGSVDDVTLSVAYSPDDHDAFIQFIIDYCSKQAGDLTITVQAVEACTEATPFGKPLTYTGCIPMGFDAPDVKRSGSGVAMLKFTFSADNVSLG